MGPKPKDKKTAKSEPSVEPKEVVSELQKEFFLFQLSDIDKKLQRLDARERELQEETQQLEEKIEEVKKEKGAVISEHEQMVALRETQKVEKRERMLQLSEEIKTCVENHKNHIQKLTKKYNDMVSDMMEQIGVLDEEVKILEDHKQNKDVYTGQLEQLEKEMEEAEMQHQRNLFEIDAKSELVKARVKKELQQRLLNLSIEFQQTSQKRIGKSCHRVTQENKAIQNAIRLMKEEVLEYQEKYFKSTNYVALFKQDQDVRQQDRDKGIARTVIQVSVIKALEKERHQLMEKLKTFTVIDADNKLLLKRYKLASLDIEKKLARIKEVGQSIVSKIEETNAMNEASKHLRRNSRKLQVLTRNALKIAEEAMAVRLIPAGGMEEERFMTNEAKLRMFKKRRDSVFTKKGRILNYLFEFLAKAQPTEEDRKLLKVSSKSIDIDQINYAQIYGKDFYDKGSEIRLGSTEKLVEEEEEKKKGPVFYTSEVSLPRSVSALVIGREQKSEVESFEGEFVAEFGGESEEESEKEYERRVGSRVEFEYGGEFDFEELEKDEPEEVEEAREAEQEISQVEEGPAEVKQQENEEPATG